MRFLATALFLVALPPLAGAAPVCTVQALVGAASAGGAPLAVGAALEAGAQLQTGPGARLRLRCVDGSTLVLADGSRLQLERYEPAAAQRPREVLLRLDQGLMQQSVSPGGGWRVRTPTAVTAVRGTEFLVEVGADSATAVHVRSGEVAVEPAAALRGLKPARPVLLQPAANGTTCGADGQCSAAASWSSERLKALQDRLTGL